LLALLFQQLAQLPLCLSIQFEPTFLQFLFSFSLWDLLRVQLFFIPLWTTRTPQPLLPFAQL
jgi:hypothetical protein